MHYNRVTLSSLLTVTSCLLLAMRPAFAVSEEEIQRELVCRCGCGNMSIRDCECSNAQKVRAEIRTKVKEGLSQRQILDYFIQRYGEEVVGAPAPWKGFNLAAWVFPFLAILVGGFLIGVVVRRWEISSRPRTGASLMSSGSDQPLNNLEARLDEELKDFE